MKDGFFRVAAATPAVSVADVEENLERIEELVQQAAADGCGAVCFPELALTAYTCGDLFRDEALLSAAERGLARLMEETRDLDILCAVGLPVPWREPCTTARPYSTRGSCWACLPSAHSQLL